MPGDKGFGPSPSDDEAARTTISKRASVFSEILLQDLRVNRVSAQILRIGDGVTLAVGKAGRPTLYSVIKGSLAIGLSAEDSVELRPGENALLFYGDSHKLGIDAHEVRLDLPRAGAAVGVEQISVGADGERCVALQCVMELSYLGKTAYANRALPALILQRRRRHTREIWDMSSFRYLPQQLLDGVEGPGGLAIATAFANLQLNHAFAQGALSLWRNGDPDVRDPNTRRVAAVIQEIRAHLDRPWTVASMARHCGLSRSALAATFTAHTGEAPIAYLTRERMERAGQLLLNKALSMHEIGQRVGYPIESSFARAFRRHWGVAPRRYEGNTTEAG